MEFVSFNTAMDYGMSEILDACKHIRPQVETVCMISASYCLAESTFQLNNKRVTTFAGTQTAVVINKNNAMKKIYVCQSIKISKFIFL